MPRVSLAATVLLAVVSLGCERNPVGPHATILRSEGEWVTDANDPYPERMRIVIDSTQLPAGSGLRLRVPLARGSVEWGGVTCPMTVFYGTVNNPDIPEVWFQFTPTYAVEQLPGVADRRGFSAQVYTLGESPAEMSAADPSSDWLLVQFDDSPYRPGSNYAKGSVFYTRASR